MTAMNGRCVVIGIGNPLRGDDAAGRAVVHRLKETTTAGIDVVELDGEVASLLACLDGAESAYLIDACVSGAAPGTVRRLPVTESLFPYDGFSMSTHGLGLAEAIELARTLGQLPPHCVVYAIEAASFRAGAPLSPPVEAAIDGVAAQLRAEIGAYVAKERRIDA